MFREVPGRDAESFWVELFHAGEGVRDLSSLVIRTEGVAEMQLERSLSPGDYVSVSTTFDPMVVQQLFLVDEETGVLLDAMDLKASPQARVAYPNGAFLQPTEASPGEANVVDVDDRVVINEVMYHHRPNYADEEAGSAYEEMDEEWIELTNRGETPVDLSGWRLRGGLS